VRSIGRSIDRSINKKERKKTSYAKVLYEFDINENANQNDTFIFITRKICAFSKKKFITPFLV